MNVLFFPFIKIYFFNQLQYRVSTYASIIVQFCWAILNIIIYTTFYQNGYDGNMQLQQVISYLWLQQAFYSLFTTWALDDDIINSITDGTVAYELCKPINIYDLWYVKNIAKRISRSIIKCIPLIIVASILPSEFRFSFKGNICTLFLFLVSMILALLLATSFLMFVYIIIFYVVSPLGVKMIFSSIVDFLSGSVIPLPYFPQNLQLLLQYSPLTYMQNIPFRIFSGNLIGMELHRAIVMQIVWLILLIMIGRKILNRAVKKIVILGG